MKILGNIIWIIFGGLIISLEYIMLGMIFCMTIIGIPFGLQLFKLGVLALVPFGQEVEYNESQSGCLSSLFNIFWIFTGGILICLQHLFLGVIFCITIVGIPFGMQHFKLMGLAFTPFGKSVS